MKKIIYFTILLAVSSIYSQVPVLNTINYNNYSVRQDKYGNYMKDINGDFEHFLGNWVWISGDQKIIITIKKITKYFDDKNKYYRDILVSDYRYTQNNGNTVIVDTNIQSSNSNNVNDYPMGSLGPKINKGKLEFWFDDRIIQKNLQGFCSAVFTFQGANPQQMLMKLNNPEVNQMIIEGNPPLNFNFGLPNNIILTKQ